MLPEQSGREPFAAQGMNQDKPGGKMKMAEKTYNVGIYCRLSNDDERDGESASIENPRLLLQRYVRERCWTEIDNYIDDG